MRGLAVVLAVCAVSAASISAAVAAAPLAAPVIKEPFTLLPCPKGSAKDTTLGMEGCAEHRIVASDKQIDQLAKQIFGKLQDNAARRRFVAGETAWLAYRRASCNSRSDVYEGGSLAVVVFGTCEAGLNTQHIADLTAFRKALTSH
jgi:uncharacterized protein YecT (DUF1311 family)